MFLWLSVRLGIRVRSGGKDFMTQLLGKCSLFFNKPCNVKLSLNTNLNNINVLENIYYVCDFGSEESNDLEKDGRDNFSLLLPPSLPLLFLPSIRKGRLGRNFT